MSVASVVPFYATAEGQPFGRYHREYTVRTTNSGDGPATIALDPRLPQPGSPWREGRVIDASVYAQYATVKQLAARVWRAAVEWGPIDPKQDAPLDLRWKRSGGGYQIDDYPLVDIDGKPFKNSAGFPYEGVAVPVAIGTYQVTRPVAVWTVGDTSNWLYTVNSSPVGGVGEGKVKVGNITWQEQVTKAGQAYVILTVEVHVHPRSWDLIFVDQGPYYLKTVIEARA